MMDDDIQHTNEEPMKFPFVFLKEITNDFSEERIIAHGTSGTIYKGVNNDGQEIAVKVFYTTQGTDYEPFQHELVNLTRFKHQNIIKLIGFCNDTEDMFVERNGKRVITVKEHKMLCFEHAHNGSLHKHFTDEQQGLDWHIRFKIIKGICEGLKYLHEGLEVPICHFDLNLTNILLDKDMIPKIANFTLSRPFGEEETLKTASTLGTVGYLPPEYMMKQVISKEFDIFSLGVIVGKIMAGPMGYSTIISEIKPVELIEHIYNNWSEKLQAMPGNTVMQVKVCAQIAVKCLEKDRCKRPNIGDIIQQLNQTGTIENARSLMRIEKDCCTGDRNSMDGLEAMTMSHEFLEEITNGFSEERILGRGAFGVVYKGVHANGTQIAVKVLRNMTGHDDRGFENEFQNLVRLKHQNIVELVGYCNESEEVLAEHNGMQVIALKQHMALCLEYVDNGSLRKHISDENEGLNWHTRYKIIRGICDGLKYLREGLEVPIWHLDLKPDNILLDKNMVPKIADFGLSRLLGDERTRKTISSVGTCGYLPPEYIESQVISSEFDIFSLGVILIKIMTGSSGYSSIVDMKPRRFIKQVHDNWRRKLQEITRPRSLEVYCQQVKRCIELAVKCLRHNRQERPTIQEIVCDLNETDIIIGDTSLWIEQLYYGESIIPFKSGTTLGSSTGTYGEASIKNNTINVLKHASPLLKELSFQFLEEITNGFSRKRKIYRGAFGTFYKGVLPSGELVVVKMFDETFGFGEKQFRDMVRVLMSLAHKNIVRLIGYCAEVHKEVQELQQNEKYFLVEAHKNLLCFEYTRNGTLDKYIHAASCGFDWNVRLKIIKGLCQGLHFLHQQSTTPIIHQRFTPDNVWLDENMAPKIAEVIIPMVLVSGNIEITEEWKKKIYQAPEDEHGSEISTKSNIYTLGLLIMQLATGVKATKFDGHEYKNWAHTSHITSKHPSLDADCINQVKSCIEIGLKCTRTDPKKRPPIGAVVSMLEGLPRSLSQKIGAVSNDLLDVYPMQLHLPFKPNKSCSLQLTNTTDDIVAIRLLTKSQKRYMAKMPLCGVVPPRSNYTFIVAMREQKKQPPSNSDEFLTLESTIVREGDLSIKNADLDSMLIEFSNFFKEAKETMADKVHELILKVVSDQTEEATSDQVTVKSFDSNEEPVSWAKCVGKKQRLMAAYGHGSIHECNQQEDESYEDFDCHVKPLAVQPTDPVVLSSPDDPLMNISDEEEDWDWDWELNLEEDSDELSRIFEELHDEEENREFSQISRGHNNIVSERKINPMDTNSFVSASMDHTIKAKPLLSDIDIIGKKNFLHVLSVDVHPTQPWILTSHHGGDVIIWDYLTQATVTSFDFTEEPVYSAKFIGREKWLVAGDGDGTIYVYSYDTQQEVKSFEAHDSRITSLAVHPTDPFLLSSSDDLLIKLWDWEKGWECTRTFEEHDDVVTQVHFNPMDTNSFATASLDQTVKIWNISSSDSKITLSDHRDGLLCVHNYTSDIRQHLIVGSWDGTAQIWDLETQRCVQTLKGHVNRLVSVYRHPELPILITGSHDGTLRLWNSTTYRLENIIAINLGKVYAFGYIKCERRIVVGCQQGIAIMEINLP